MKLLDLCSGCTAADENYNPLHKGDIVKQYHEVMRQHELVLADCGATWDDVVMRRIYVLDMDDFFNQKNKRDYWTFGKHPPFIIIEVSRLSNKDFLIEMDLIA